MRYRACHVGHRTVRFLPFAVLFVYSHLALAGGVTGRWSQLTPYPTTITNNAVTSVCDGSACTIYSFMGMTNPNASGSVMAASFKLTSPGTGSWVSIADAPLLNGKAKIAASAVTVRGDVYLLGGYTLGLNEVTEHRLFRYDAVGDAYVSLADVPTPVDDTVAVVYKDRYIYLMSGWNGPTSGNVTNVQVYDVETNTWQQATPIPIAGRFGHAGGLIGDRLVMIDGSVDTGQFTVVHETVVGVIDANDVSLITWSQPAASPFTQTYRAANAQPIASCQEMIFVGGTDNPYNFNGTGYDGQPSTPLDQVMLYNVDADQWSLVVDSNAPHTPTMDHRGLVWFDGKWVTVGGMTAPGTATTAVNAIKMAGVCPLAEIPVASEWGLVIFAIGLIIAATLLGVIRRCRALEAR